MADTTACVICTKPKDYSYASIHKHHFSNAHANDIKNALFTRKTLILSNIQNEKPISIYFKSPNKCFYICIPCSYLKPTTYRDGPKEHNCGNSAKNRELIKDILTNMTERIKKEGEEVVEEVSSEEVILLRETVKKLEEDTKKAKKIDHRALDMKDALFSVMSDLREKDFELFKDKMTEMKREYSLAFEVIYKELGGVEGHESEFNEED